MATHELKCWPKFYWAIQEGLKTFEYRKNDRGYDVDDDLLLQLFAPCERCKGKGRVPDNCDFDTCPECQGAKGEYLGQVMKVKVTYKLDIKQPFGPDDCIMSIKRYCDCGREFCEQPMCPICDNDE
jgi:RecJ-like exonuclease